MVTAFGKQYSRVELEKRIGHLSQFAGVRMMELKDGYEAGVRIAEVRTGSGLRFQVTLDRGMDISVADFKGMPLAWRAPVGDVHPHHYIPAGTGWLRSFPGGLMTGCGISQAGASCVDEGQEFPMHGRLSHTPAYDVHTSSVWNGDQCLLRLEGFVREYATFHENLSLHRVVECELGGSVITLRDTVTNDANLRSPVMMLYHINIGWPLVDSGSVLLVNARTTEPRDEQAKLGLDVAHTFSGPVSGYREQVFFHELNSGQDGFSTVLLANRVLQRGIFVRFRQRELPRFIEWKMMGEGTFVVGLEPANCLTRGRAEERKRGTLQFLEPGERREFVVQIGVLEGQNDISNFATEHSLR